MEVAQTVNSTDPNSPSWKITTLRFAAFGAGFAVMLCVIAGGASWYSHRPKPEKPWNRVALKASSTDTMFTVQSDRAVGDFRYSIENTTDKDYRLPADAKIMVRLAKDMSYRDAPNMTWEQSLYIPAGQRVNVSITLPIMYSDFNFSKEKADDEKQLSVFMDRRLAEIDGFVLFDSTNRYKVDFPNAWPEAVRRAKERAPRAAKSDAK
jgi:uncharacterized lipoprotein YbaY